MKKIIISLASVAALFVIAVFGYFTFFVKDESQIAESVVQTETISQSASTDIQPKVIKSGAFNQIDKLHYATGDVVVEEFAENYKIKFKSNFASAEGPDLYVYLSQPQVFKNSALAGLDTKKTINLGVLKNINGEQEYLVSKSDFEKHDAAVIIWCKQFGIQFSRAELN